MLNTHSDTAIKSQSRSSLRGYLGLLFGQAETQRVKGKLRVHARACVCICVCAHMHARAHTTAMFQDEMHSSSLILCVQQQEKKKKILSMDSPLRNFFSLMELKTKNFSFIIHSKIYLNFA